MGSNAVAIRDTAVAEPSLKQRIKALILKEASDQEIDLVVTVCDRYGFDPLLKHIVIISHNIYVTRDGLLDNAHRSGVFDGIGVASAEKDADGKWVATVSVWRKDMTHPFTYTAYQPEHEVLSSSAWRKAPRAMTVKCAEVMALKRAFNISIGTAEEMGYDNAEAEITATTHGIRLPWGVTPEQWANFRALATGKGVNVEPTMTPDEIAGAIRRAGGPAIPGKITPGNAWEALKRLPEHVDVEADVPASSDESPIEGESREDDDTFSDEAMAETARKSEAARQRALTGN